MEEVFIRFGDRPTAANLIPLKDQTEIIKILFCC